MAAQRSLRAFVAHDARLARKARPLLATESSWTCGRCSHTRGYHNRSPDQTRHNKIGAQLKIEQWSRMVSTGSTKSKSTQFNSKDLPSQQEKRVSHLSHRFASLMDTLQSNVFVAGQRLNDLTGYSGIEALKNKIDEQETSLEACRALLADARTAYTAAIADRANSQREVNTLLHRKDSWSPSDLERFTALYRSDHTNEQSEIAARERLTTAEKGLEEIATRLNATILARYHEEQIWSDKIRRMSTWGTWGLMGVNVFLFLIFQVAVEPWRRKRLVSGFEEKVMAALEKEEVAQRAETRAQGDVTAVGNEPVKRDMPGSSVAAISDIHASSLMPISSWSDVRQWLASLVSEKPRVLRQVDLTAAVVQGALAGMTIGGLLVVLARPR